MLAYLEYLSLHLSLPQKLVISIVGLFVVTQVVGELMELKGLIAPEFLKVRKLIVRRRKEKENLQKVTELLPFLQEVPETLENVKQVLISVDAHYSKDNITMRDNWMANVNRRLDEADEAREGDSRFIRSIAEKLDKNNEDTLSLLIESKRNTIINFADLVIDDSKPVTREQFNRVFRIHTEYEEIIAKSGRTNGEVDIAIRIIQEAYENHMRKHSFVEDIRGYNI